MYRSVVMVKPFPYVVITHMLMHSPTDELTQSTWYGSHKTNT